MAFDYDAARADGYSDAEIADYLAKQNKFDISGARKAGYNDTEILGHLAPKAGFKIAPPVEPEQTTPGRLSPKYGGQTTDQQTEYKQGSTKNPFHGAIARAANLLGEGVEGIARLGEAGGDWMESKIPLSGLTQEQIKNERQLEPLFQFAQSAKNWSKSIGYEPSTQISELTDNPLNAIPFIAERVISSSPDMAAAVAAAPAYWLSRTNEIVNDRLKNDNKTIDQVTMGDVSAAAGAAALEVTLEKFATKHLLKGAPITGKTAIGRMAKEVGFQSLTEGAEEGIGYLGGTVGTEKGVDPKELAMQSLEGAIVGGGLGGAVKGTQEAATKYAEYREKKRQALMAEGVDEDIANQAVDQMDKERAAVQGAAAEVKSGEGLKPNGEPDLDYLEQKFGRQEAPAPTLALPAPEAVAPEVAAPKAAPVVAQEEVVAPQVAAELPPVAPVAEERKEVVLQNRDRTTPGSISQMQSIAANPDYKRLGTNTVATVGAPIVFGNVTLNDAQFGNQEEITDERGNRYPVQYAVVDAEDMLASNNADGSPNKDYASFQGLRAIGGNGRLAGLQSAYERGSADKYREELMNDARHGINSEVISEFKNPVLVRLMDPAMVDENTADNFNVAGTQEMDIVSMAKNDTRRVDLERLEFKDNGELTQDAVARFVAAMPVSEQNALIGDNGRPNKKAEARAEAAVFQKAYGNEELTALAFSDTSEEAKNIRRALNDVAPLMMRLEGMGDYDFREQLNEAVMKAITAKRNGLSLDEAARQAAIDEHPLVNHIVQMFADNARSARKISDNLGKLAALSAIEGKPIEDQLFESLITRRSQEELVRAAFEKEVDRLVKVAEKAEKAAEKVAEKAAEKKVEEKPAETIDSKELADWTWSLTKKGKKKETETTTTENGVKYDVITTVVNAKLNNEQKEFWKKLFGDAKVIYPYTTKRDTVQIELKSGDNYKLTWVREQEFQDRAERDAKAKEIHRLSTELESLGGRESRDLETIKQHAKVNTLKEMDAEIAYIKKQINKAKSAKGLLKEENWRGTEYADRIEEMLTKLRNAGEEDFAGMLNAAFSQAADSGQITEASVSFREESVRKRLAAVGEMTPLKYEPMTTDKFGRVFTNTRTLPIEIQQAAVDRWNEIAPKLYALGFRYNQTQASNNREAKDLDKQLIQIPGALSALAGRRYAAATIGLRKFKTEENRIKAIQDNDAQLARWEAITSEVLNLDTSRYPDIDTSRPMDIYGDFKKKTPEDMVLGDERAKIFDEPVAKAEEAVEGASDEAVADIAEDFAGAMASQEEGGWQETHVFDPPTNDEIVRLDEKVRVYHAEHGWMTPAQAKKEIQKWKDNVDKQYDGMEEGKNQNYNKVVLSLFDLSGEWSKPWAEAGYQVYQFDIQDNSTYTDPETGEEKLVGDVNNFNIEFFNDLFGSFDGNDIYAILAACPCTDFASSGARHFAAKDASGQTIESVELVHQTLRTIEYFKPQVWAIENPVGRIEKLSGLPPWRLSFNPNQFGDPYTKRTLLWGRFNADLPIAPVEPTEGSKMHRLYGGKSQATKNARSVTPEGFAYAFFQANNAVDHPVMAIANKYDRLDRDLFQQAVDAGLTFDEMNQAVEDPYYMDQDDEQAAQNLVDAIAEKTGEDSSNWSIVLGQSISNAANDTVRKQQISELQSVKQQMSAIERRLAKAELKPTDEAIYKTLYNSSRRLRDDIKYTYQPNKSPAKVLADAAKALANGDIEQEVFDVIDYLYKKNPNVLDGLRLSIRKQKAGTEQMAKGQFNGLARIVRLFKETDGVKDPSTIRHELAHSLEQMMTAEARERVNNVWRDKLLRASKAEKTEAGKKYFENVAKYLVAPSEKTWTDAVSSMPNISYYQYISPSEFWAANAEPLMKARMGGAWEKFKTAVRGMYEGLKNIFGITNKYAVHSVFKQVMDGERLGTEQLDDYFIRTGFKPLFSASKHKNVFGNEPAESSWMSPIIGQYSFNGFMKKYKEYLVNQTPIGKWIDHIVYKLGDKFVDLKRVQKAIGKNLGEAFDAYMRETLYHGRVSAKLEEYMQYEVMPLLDKMVKYGIDKPLLNKFLHARHAEEYNQHINNINPNAAPGMPMHNRGSGMSTEEAQAFMDSLTPEQHRHLTELADKVDDMVRKTQDELVDGQIEKPETIQMWRDSFPFYVPLYRTELDYANTSAGIGRGFSTQSGFGKSATGSLKDVDDILSNITAQRERAVVRSEKGKVARAVYAMAVQNPNSKFWLPVNPRAGVLGKLNKAYAEYQGKLDDLETIQKIIETNQVNGVPESEYHDLIQKERNLRSSVTRSLNAYKKMQFEAKDAMVALRKELSELGLSQQDIVNYIQEPEVPYIDPTSGKVKYKPNTIARNSASVLSVPVDGETRYIFFNPSDATALRMVESLKNLDADKIEGAMKMFNWYTQNIAKLSTQWNLVFGAINFLRDVQGAMLNLTTTPIAGKQKEVFKNIGPALAGIYAEQRLARESKRGKSEWSKLWKEFQEEGGQTGFRDQFAKTEEQKSRIDRELKKMQHGTPIQKARAVFEWISDVNETAENAVRLSAYKVAKAKFLAEGMSEANARARAAEVGKNLTVNFNRKGASTKTANALYAFFNASVQGTARMFQTLTGPKGKMIMGGLVAIGIADALAMAAAGFDEDEPPEFVRQRNLIIPVGGGKYAQIPMPLGFNYFVNFGRIVTELGIHPGKRGIDAVKNLLTLTTESVNPLGQGNIAYQLAPTFADPLVGLVSNKDAFGRPIYKEDQATNPLPGYLRAKESASGLATWVSKQINSLTGGTEYRQGMFTPTPDQLEYIVGQLTGGVGREIQRGAKYTAGIVEGKPREEVAWHQVPVAGRFFGETTSQSNVSDKFYKNVTELAEYEHEIRGRRKDKKDVQEFLDEHPEAKLWSSANAVENQISQLKQLRKKAKEKGDDARIKKINEQITRVMDQFNRRYKSAIQ